MEKVFDYGDLKLDGSEVYTLLERMKTQETPATILKDQLDKGFFTMEGGSETQYVMFMRIKDMIVYFMSRYHVDSTVNMISQTPEGQKMLEESKKSPEKYSTFLGGILSNPKSHSVIEKLANGAFNNCVKLTEFVKEGEYDLRNIQEVESGAFKGSYFKNIELPLPEKLEGSTFDSCHAEYIDIPNVKNFGSRTFYQCKELKHINMPNFVESYNTDYQNIFTFL